MQNSSLNNMNDIHQSTANSMNSDARETHRLIASDKVEGTSVCRSSGDKIGSIERLMIDKTSGKVAYVVMSFGGFLGMGEDYYTLPWSVLKYNTEMDAYEVNLAEEQLSSAPRQSDLSDSSYDVEWENKVHDHYKTTPYWGM
jgi:sporulation protein YlmC with PRC-barrel domain